MLAATCRRYGAPEVLKIEGVARPTLKADEILVQVRASSVTSGDVRMRAFTGAGIFWLPMRLLCKPAASAAIVPPIGRNVKPDAGKASSAAAVVVKDEDANLLEGLDDGEPAAAAAAAAAGASAQAAQVRPPSLGQRCDAGGCSCLV